MLKKTKAILIIVPGIVIIVGFIYIMQQVQNANKAIDSLNSSQKDFDKKQKALVNRLKEAPIERNNINK